MISPSADRDPGLSVVVPVYNAEGRLQILADRVAAALVGFDFELILVNDGSVDGSWHEIVAISENPRIRGIDLMRNYGQHNALLAGIRAAEKQMIVTIDDDLQNPPEEIPRLVDALSHADLVYGVPVERQHGRFRNLGTTLAKVAIQVAVGREMARSVSAFRAFRTELRHAFADFSGSYVSIDVLLSWGARHIEAVRVEHHARLDGHSAYSFGRLATHALNVLTGFSTRPLRVASLMGVAMTGFGVSVLAAVVIRYFVAGNPVPGFTFISALISIFSGAQLLTLGIIGEYLARMHVRVMNRPPYVVHQIVGSPRS